MFDKCFTCLPPAAGLATAEMPVFPKSSYETLFTPNERVWVAESPDMFYGLEAPVERTATERAVAGVVGAGLIAGIFWLVFRKREEPRW